MGKKKAPPLTKRFNNGHKCQTGPESMAIQENYNRVDRARQNFYDRVDTMKKSRNVLLGEKTSRVDAPPLVPHDRLPARPGEEPYRLLAGTLSAKSYNRPLLPTGKMSPDMSKIKGYTTRRNALDDELEMLNQRILHKKLVLSFSQGGRKITDKGMHPAIDQVISTKNITIPYIGENEV